MKFQIDIKENKEIIPPPNNAAKEIGFPSPLDLFPP